MRVFSRYVAAVAAVAALTVGLVLPAASGAAEAQSSRAKIKLTCKTPLKGSKVSGTCTGSFGNIKSEGTLTNGYTHATVTMFLKGGKAVMTYTITSNSTGFTANWKWKSGTGKYSGIKGGGSLTGDFKGNVIYTGTASY